MRALRTVVTAQPEYLQDGSPHPLSRQHSYEGECGRKFTILAWPGLPGMGIVGAVGGYLTGLLVPSDEYFPLLLTGGFMAFIVIGLLRAIGTW